MMCEYYEINAKPYAEETFSADMSEQYRRFLPLLRERARILDVGSGSGRDACYFQKLWISGNGIGTVKESLQRNPESFLRGNCMF